MSFWSRVGTVFKNMTVTQKIIAVNTGIFLAWRLRVVPQEWMAKHFSFSRYNIDQGRMHTMFTYGFSNMYFFSYLFDTLTIFLFGRSIEMRYGANRLLKLMLLGVLAGGVTMSIFDRRMPVMVPHVGATTAVSALLTFEACMNMGQKILFFVFPMRIELLVGFLVFQSLFLDPLHRSFGGIVTGAVAFALFKRGLF